MAIDIKKTDFELKVIKESHNRPVLIDFWAPWCNPCKALGPVLEKLETEYGGRFVLVKINTEIEKELATSFKINSIPYVALLYKSLIKDSFYGALNETLVRKFLDKNLPHPSFNEIEVLIKNSAFEDAGERILNENLKSEAVDEYLWIIIKHFLSTGKNLHEIKKFTDQMSDFGSRYNDIKSTLKGLFIPECKPEDLKEILKVFSPELINQSLEYFLEKITHSSGEEKEKQKKYLFLCFLILDKNPIVNEYRKKLSQVLF